MKYIEDKVENLLKEFSIHSAPIDPIKCAKNLGVVVQSVDLDSDVSGLFVTKDNVSYIMYNRSEQKVRQRFTIAHELGHFVLHKDVSLFIDKTQRVLYRDSSSTTGEKLKEREANAFAAALLMPRTLIDMEVLNIPNDKDIVEFLSKKFNVSELAMSFRLSNLGYEIGW